MAKSLRRHYRRFGEKDRDQRVQALCVSCVKTVMDGDDVTFCGRVSFNSGTAPEIER